MPAIRSDRRPRGAVFLPALLVLTAGVAGAADFPASGTITVNDNSGALPAGGKFAGSSYDSTSGAIAPGQFVFPAATITFPTSLGTVVARYKLSQLNTSSGQVAQDGVAALTVASMKLQILSATLGGVIPINVGTCVFAPIDVLLDGIGAASGLDLASPEFKIPPVGSSDCGGYGDQINDAIATSHNTMQIQIAGDFTPPASDDDTIFKSGFDPARGTNG